MPKVQYSLIHANAGEGAQERKWIEAIILWRGQPDSNRLSVLDTAAVRRATQAYRSARRAAEDQGRTFLGAQVGGTVWTASYDRASGELFIQDQVFRLTERDSALVVLVDRAENARGAPVVIGSTWVGRELPSEAWSQSWTSGDTTFIVRPRQRKAHLLALLRRSPAVQAFLQ